MFSLKIFIRVWMWSILFSLFIAACNSFFFLDCSYQFSCMPSMFTTLRIQSWMFYFSRLSSMCDVDDLNEMNCNNVNSNLKGTYRMGLCFCQYTPACCLHFIWGYYLSVWRLCLAGITSYAALGRHCFCLSCPCLSLIVSFLVVIGKRSCVCYLLPLFTVKILLGLQFWFSSFYIYWHLKSGKSFSPYLVVNFDFWDKKVAYVCIFYVFSQFLKHVNKLFLLFE